MIKSTLISAIFGLILAPLALAIVVVATSYLAELGQDRPNWDTASHIAKGYIYFFGPIAAIAGFFMGVLAGIERYPSIAKRKDGGKS